VLSCPIMRTITQYCLRALFFLPAVLIIGLGFVRPWMITSARELLFGGNEGRHCNRGSSRGWKWGQYFLSC
jgi:hypothetical protein